MFRHIRSILKFIPNLFQENASYTFYSDILCIQFYENIWATFVKMQSRNTIMKY